MISTKICLSLPLFLILPLHSCNNITRLEKPNVLFIAVDDLACVTGGYGDPVAKTPHLDLFARKGVIFQKAYNQMPLCNPTRASLMTGLRPDRTTVYDLDRHFRDELPGVVTLSQLFRLNGWWAGRVGKIYHYNVPDGIGTNGLDDPGSWDKVINPKGRDTAEEHLITNAESHRPISAALSWLAAGGTDEEQTDGLVANEAIRLMKEHIDEPFFLGVGFFRPHTPYVAPVKYFDLYPFDSIELPWSPNNDREDIPLSAFAHNCPIPNYGLPDSICRRALQAYYACVSFVDAQFGKLMQALEELGLADNTIVVVWSDHGYHLGEHKGIWQKRTLFEESARAPFMIYHPAAKGNGIPCRQIVEFVDIYPTLAELCKLDGPAHLEGKSLVPLLGDPALPWHGEAYTQILRPGFAHPEGLPVMGRSIRTDRWRYTEWNGGTEGRELYDHRNDPFEFTNLAGRPEFAKIIGELRDKLDQNARGEVPDTPFNPTRL